MRCETTLAKIAALTVQRTHSDARVAIKTLYYSVTQASDSLDDCFERARRDVVIDMIADLSDTALMTLRAVATSGSEFAKDIYARYRRYCVTRGEKPISYVYFCSNLSYLQSAGLVALVSTKVGRSYPPLTGLRSRWVKNGFVNTSGPANFAAWTKSPSPHTQVTVGCSPQQSAWHFR